MKHRNNTGSLCMLIFIIVAVVNFLTFALFALRSKSMESVTGSPTYINPPPKTPTPSCTAEQMEKISTQMMIPKDSELNRNEFPEDFLPSQWLRCPDAKWLKSFYKEEEDIGSSDNYFLGISVGCNKGHDAIRTARMGMSSAEFDAVQWKNAFGPATNICNQENDPQATLVHPKRKGEMHCIEPMPTTFATLKDASDTLGMEQKGFFLANLAISSTHGTVQFQKNQTVGFEADGIGSCKTDCQDVPASSLDQYMEKNVKGKGPVNILQIDVEGWDFDVLFGASSVLDRTHYLEFEYHYAGNWNKLHLHDAVRLLDTKGFTCYWATEKGVLWRITECYFDFFNYWHKWSNVACVHRSQDRLWGKMEKIFEETLASSLPVEREDTNV